MFELVTRSDEFDRDFKRLARHDATLARELVDLMTDCLMREGRVPDMYQPHVLNNPGGVYNGCMEFHLADDVLVLYYPPKPRSFIRMVAILTHNELHTGRRVQQWPDQKR